MFAAVFPKYWRKLSRILAQEGAPAVLVAVARKPVNYIWERRRLSAGDSFDRALGLDTGYSDQEEQKFPAMMPETQQGYDPIGIETFRKILVLLPIRFEEFCFVDLGSGKGRALMLAASFPFNRIVGVEYSSHYHEIARGNLEAFRRQSGRCPPIESLNGDAAAFPIPSGKIVVFLFNPFQGSTFSSVVDNLRSAVNRSDSDIYVVYVNPACRRELDDAAEFQVFHSEKHHDPYRNFVIYHASSMS